MTHLRREDDGLVAVRPLLDRVDDFAKRIMGCPLHPTMT